MGCDHDPAVRSFPREVVDLSIGQPVGGVDLPYGRVVLLLGSALELMRYAKSHANLLVDRELVRRRNYQRVGGPEWEGGVGRSPFTNHRRLANGARRETVSGLLRQPGFEGFLGFAEHSQRDRLAVAECPQMAIPKLDLGAAALRLQATPHDGHDLVTAVNQPLRLDGYLSKADAKSSQNP